MEYNYGKTYKYKDLFIYSSVEWMADLKRKYRTVFEQNEIDYLRFQLEFFNKLFDEQDWEAKISMKVTDENDKSWFDKTEQVKISKEQNIYTYSSNWGVDDLGGYWKKGTYTIKAYINDELVKEQIFYIYNLGVVTNKYNPYFEVVSVRVFEGGFDLPNEKKYMKVFKFNATKYVWVEFQIQLKVEKGTQIEYTVNFLDEAGQSKAAVTERQYTSHENGTIVKYYTGWGSEHGGSWVDDKYYINIVFMDKLVGATFFEMGDEFVEGNNFILGNSLENLTQNVVQSSSVEQDTSETLDDVMLELKELIGLQSIKQQIDEHIKYLEYLRVRKEKGVDDKERIVLHSVFTGNPGTGKTTVVRLLGKIYQKLGLLTKGHVHEVNRTHLVGEFIGQTAPKTQAAIDKARGGILFIDEAYSLFRSKDDDKDFGREVIEILIKTMSDSPTDIAIMVAGYPHEMDVFLESNPGMRSRFKYYFSFPDYTPDELEQIVSFAATKRNVSIADDAFVLIKKMIQEAYRNRDKSFGNARFSYYLVDQAKMNLGLRITAMENYKDLSIEEISKIEKQDVDKIMLASIKGFVELAIDDDLLKSALNELNSLVGLDNIKKDVNEMVKLVRYYKEIGERVVNTFSLHAIFTGNPGTGKTTVARIMGRIYKALGLLEKGHIVETGRDGLIAEYIGQTAIKTKQVIDSAIGGILFIDEAYGLADSKYSYGSEAIEVILKQMEDQRGKFVVIAAGYPDNMDVFLKSNPGLMSRFDKFFHFIDYTAEEMFLICKFMLGEKNMTLNEEAKVHLSNYIKEIWEHRDKYFGNAREVRRFVVEVVKKQNLRMADMPKELRSFENIRTVTLEDVKHLVYLKPQGKTFGFKNN